MGPPSSRTERSGGVTRASVIINLGRRGALARVPVGPGKRSAEEARQVTADTTVAHSMGRNAPYAERLLIDVPQGGTHDLDESMISGSFAKQAAQGKVRDLLTGVREEAAERRTGADAPDRPGSNFGASACG